MLCVLILVFRKDDPIEVAADEVAEYDTCIHADDLKSMELPESERDAKVIEGIGHAVGEAADDEERNTEQEREILLLTGELNGCSHNETASYAQKAATDSSGTKAKLEDSLSGRLDLERRHAGKERSDKTSYDVSEKDHEQLSDFPFVYESCCTGIKFQSVAHYSKESEREQNCTGKGAISLRLNACSKKTESGGSDCDAGKY